MTCVLSESEREDAQLLSIGRKESRCEPAKPVNADENCERPRPRSKLEGP